MAMKSIRVKSGDSLWKIAKANGTTVAALYKANPALQARKNAGKGVIFSGSTVRIPGVKSSAPSSVGPHGAPGAMKRTPNATNPLLGGRQRAAARDAVKSNTTSKPKVTTTKSSPGVMGKNQALKNAANAKPVRDILNQKAGGRQQAAYRDQQNKPNNPLLGGRQRAATRDARAAAVKNTGVNKALTALSKAAPSMKKAQSDIAKMQKTDILKAKKPAPTSRSNQPRR